VSDSTYNLHKKIGQNAMQSDIDERWKKENARKVRSNTDKTISCPFLKDELQTWSSKCKTESCYNEERKLISG
jgi:hypothetical protein